MEDIPSNRKELEKLVLKKEKLKYVFFWGHTQKQKDIVDKSCFSQWFPSEFVIDRVSYKTAEHYMMAEKARLFNDSEALEKVLASGHPKQAKAFGRQVKNFNPKLWDERKFDVVVEANIAKFSQNNELLQFLVTTNTRILVEASPADKIWGIGLDQHHKDAGSPMKWNGENLLGFALMKVREKLRESTI